MHPIRIWIDTDVGDNPDDAVALLLARAHPSIDLVGVSVVGAEAARRAGVARRLLGDGFSDPIVQGGEVGAAVGGAAPDGVVAIGPLTNLAVSDVDVPVTVMGGTTRAVHHRGSVRAVEANFGADPESARIALRRLFCRLVPLDVTRRLVLDAEGVDVLRACHPELAAQIDAWPQPVCLHDPLALLIAVDDVEYEDDVERLTVDRRGRLVRGRGIEQRVVIDADIDGARRRVLDLLGG